MYSIFIICENINISLLNLLEQQYNDSYIICLYENNPQYICFEDYKFIYFINFINKNALILLSLLYSYNVKMILCENQYNYLHDIFIEYKKYEKLIYMKKLTYVNFITNCIFLK